MTTSPNMPHGSIALGAVCGILTAIVWGAWPVLTRFGLLQTLSVYDLVALRLFVSGIILLPVVMRRGAEGVGWGKAFILAAGAGIGYTLAAATGLSMAPAGHGGIIIPSTMLTCTMVGGWLLLNDRPDRMRLLGYGGILCGVMLIGYEGFSRSVAESTWHGDIMFVVAGAFWALYTVTARLCGASPLHATALVSVISMVLYLPVYLYFNGTQILQAPIGELVFHGIFQGVVAAIIALVLYTKTVRILGATRGALFAALVPAVAVLLAFIILGEQPNAMEIGGLAVVSISMYYALGLTKLRNQG